MKPLAAKCPECGDDLKVVPGGSWWFCPNEKCESCSVYRTSELPEFKKEST